ncbi:MAG TPA: PQQ-binding-like beta-propeller repeat protein [Phycisphaerales bacterium]|jgi:glucose dehydrogenase|nr:PQQ-binding-like beta-propeller repeat protein [Phycisphaerales bacterium]
MSSDRQTSLTTADLLFVAFNGRVIAVDRTTGEPVWRWQSRRGSYITLLPDGDALFVCANGYTWALDPRDGREIWYQPFKGEGSGIPSLATMRGAANSGAAAEKAARDAQAAQQAAASST